MSEDDLDPFEVPDVIDQATYTPCPTDYPELVHLVTPAIQLPLPFHITAEYPLVAARLANLTKEQCWAQVQDPYAHTALEGRNTDTIAVDNYVITKRDIIQVYFSPYAYHTGFDIELNFKKFDDYQ